jgi:hypothetical protein
MSYRPEKYVSICSHSQVALKALQAVKTMSPLVQQCQKALNDISTHHSVGLIWVPKHSWRSGIETADEITKEGTVHQFIGPEPALGVSKQLTRRIKCWIDNWHMAIWQVLTRTQTQAKN